MRRVMVVGAVALPLLTACPGSLDDPAPYLAARDGAVGPEVDAGPPCPDVVAEILSDPEGCAQSGCHAADVNQADLDLASPDIVGRLSGQPATPTCSGEILVDPANPEQSLLYTKLLDSRPCGSRMPLTPPYLEPTQTECVRRWLVDQLEAPADAGVPTDAGRPGPDAGIPDAGVIPEQQFFEAEAADVVEAPMEVQNDANASGGQYVVVPVGPPLNDDPNAADVGRIELSFTLDTAATVRVWLRARVADIDSNSVWARMDQGAWVRFNDVNLGAEGGWLWDEVHDSDNADAPWSPNLGPGQHTLEVKRREAGAQLDRLLISTDPAFDPNA